MSKNYVIAIDLMGGDTAPLQTIKGVQIAQSRHPYVQFKLFGNKDIITRNLPDIDLSEYDFVHTDKVIRNEDKPSMAIRKSANTSMRLAIEEVAAGRAHAAVSAGNTGALMALSLLILRSIEGIKRPAICTMVPTRKGFCALLDMGATLNSDPSNFLEMAVMGNAFYESITGKRNNRIAILNIGMEDVKGHETLREASDLIKNSKINENFIGYVEPDNIFHGAADIVVTDGFTGNIFIKTCEALGKWLKEMLVSSFTSSLLSKLGALFASRSLKATMKILDPRGYNGAMFVGLNGVSVKSHGSTDAMGFSRALDVAILLVQSDINNKIQKKITELL